MVNFPEIFTKTAKNCFQKSRVHNRDSTVISFGSLQFSPFTFINNLCRFNENCLTLVCLLGESNSLLIDCLKDN